VSTSDDATALCLSCGLCCDGTLFRFVPLEPEEAKRLEGRVTPYEGGMAQPCLALDGVKCRVYADRPSVCRKFRCLALQQLEAGEISGEDAHEFIQETLGRRASLAQALGMEDEIEAVRRARDEANAGTLAEESLRALERLSRSLMFLNLSMRPPGG